MIPNGSNVTRRDMFRLRSVRDPSASPAAPPSLGRLNGGDLLLAHRPAMGSFFEVRLSVRTPGGAQLARDALDLVDAIEDQLTIYRDHSLISRLNARAHLEPFPVDAALFDLIECAIRIGRETEGAYDLASGALSIAWGFIRGPRRVPSEEQLREARERSGIDHLRLDPFDRTVAFDRPGLVLNFGSIGKGYAVDRIADLIKGYWFPTSALIHGGRSSLFALGSPPEQPGERWVIAVDDPRQPGHPAGHVRLRNRGLATSGGAFQWFEAGGKIYSHLLDPRTGMPIEDQGPCSVTVLAPTSAVADALATAFSVLGPEASAPYLDRHPEVGAVFLEAVDDRLEHRTFNLDDIDYRPVRLASADVAS